MTKYLGIVGLLLLLLAGCSESPEKPDNLIPQKKYVDLMVELQLVRSYADNTQTDSTTIDSLTQVIFKKYKVSAQQFRTSHDYYQHFPKKQKERVEQAIEELKMDQVSVDSTDFERQIPKHH
ncbi:MAG TPA: DUF4296 domain-containing protein [Balneolaceae bacterium]|nr:DUF4296 domain-containing protein [Balneolaceae bacterium]